MTGTEIAKAYHNAIATLSEGYGHVLEVVATENAALRLKVAELEARLAAAKNEAATYKSQRVADDRGPVEASPE